MNHHDFSDEYFMREALKEAYKAADIDEVPVGAVLVKDGQILATAHNQKESCHDATAHAELLALQEAMKVLGDWRLNGTTLYSTLEPCPMCASAMLHARIDRVVYGAKDPKWGAAGSVIQLCDTPLFNHKLTITYVEMPACANILTAFFREIRHSTSQTKQT